MVTQLTPGEDDLAATMACIGYVCTQWALLEAGLLAVLSACQNISIDEASIAFGGLDMKPRLGTAINLAEFHRWKPPLQKRLRELRSSIDKQKLVDKRNMLIHGVHEAFPKPQHFVLFSPRKKGAAQRETWSIIEAHSAGQAIREAALEAFAIFNAYGEWKFPNHRHEDLSGQIVATPIGRLARLKQYFSTCRDHRWG